MKTGIKKKLIILMFTRTGKDKIEKRKLTIVPKVCDANAERKKTQDISRKQETVKKQKNRKRYREIPEK